MNKPTKQQLQDFLKLGIGTSIYQLSAPKKKDLGLEPNQWDSASGLTVPHSNITTSAWETIFDYLPVLKRLGFKRIRLSLEWNYIEPVQGQFNQLAINHYIYLIKKCHFYGIEPMLTMYHFTHPNWFDKLGGFEKENNISYFLEYCKMIFKYLSPYVSWWCTINEPAVIAFSGYLFGQFPPHKKIHFKLATIVLKNLLKAHVDVCEMIEKNQSQTKNNIKVGLVHNALRFESQSQLITKFFTKPLTEFTDDLVMNFLQEGELNYRGIKYNDSRPKGNCIYLNIYGDVQVGYNGITCQPHQKMGEMFIAIYPESYDKVLERASNLHLPILITETGIADQFDTIRPDFIIQIFKSVINKISLGLDIQGLYFWTLKDNYEWSFGNTKHFGLFNQNNIARNSAYLFQWLISNMQNCFLHESSPEGILRKWLESLNIAEKIIAKENMNFFKKNLK